uniref:NADH-ubiquinone oxidoreductase chain 3 n=1 Tax=Lanthanaphalara mira TaxID=2218050 RepID=A0A344A2G3_9HEMI|nr:NADH dehydrogenase subunit 3 [Lanthanaphalara mira]AWU48954.1 NADH dehydrogenase subunit 3 [Lanthanaphalara mira]
MIYFMMKFILIILTIMFMLIKMVVPLISMHKKVSREKMSPFECGFDILSSSRISFSIQFFTVALMFLIFDVEISILIPVPLSMKLISMKKLMCTLIMLISALILGIMLEWKEGSMNWK